MGRFINKHKLITSIKDQGHQIKLVITEPRSTQTGWFDWNHPVCIVYMNASTAWIAID